IALSILASTAMDNPVKIRAIRSNQSWMLSISIADQANEIFVAHSGNGPKSTGFLAGSISPITGKPIPHPLIELSSNSPKLLLKVTHMDVHDRLQGPFEVPFDPDLALVAGQKDILEKLSQSWLVYGGYDDKKLVYFTALLSYRCALDEIRYSFGNDGLGQIFPLSPCDPKDPHAIKADNGVPTIYVEVPKSADYTAIQLSYKDGTFSDLQRFQIVP
ncbi:hypothetical protein N9K16_02395, partial [Alphaproteobacteria bacterium]|nr:hypothetical protein [Alphaproteobacteria bacterium]